MPKLLQLLSRDHFRNLYPNEGRESEINLGAYTHRLAEVAHKKVERLLQMEDELMEFCHTAAL
jgi:hypothetical protein